MVNITNYYERIRALLASQFQDNPDVIPATNFQKFLAAFCTSAQDLQTQLNNLLNNRSLYTAVGLQLDGLGQILNLPRTPGQSDESYREALIFRVRALGSSGTPEDVIGALKFFTKADTIYYTDLFPAAYIMATDGFVFPPNPSDLVPAIQQVSPAGVAFDAVITWNIGETTPLVPFAFAGGATAFPFHVAPEPFTSVQLETDAGFSLYAEPAFGAPTFGGWFAEYGTPIDTEGAGVLSEALQINGNIPLG